MAYSISQKAATSKYIKNNYDEIKIRVPKGKKEIYKKLALMSNLSLNSFIVNLLNNELSSFENNIPSLMNVKKVFSTMAIEDMYFSDDFVDKAIKISRNELTTDQVRKEILEKYAGS